MFSAIRPFSTLIPQLVWLYVWSYICLGIGCWRLYDPFNVKINLQSFNNICPSDFPQYWFGNFRHILLLLFVTFFERLTGRQSEIKADQITN